MALGVWQATIVDETGNVQDSASIEVRRESTGALSAIYSDRDGTTPLTNPFDADEDGFARFYAAGGAFKITATLGGFSRTWRHVPIGALAERDALYPERTLAEISAEVTPTDYSYKPLDVRRYGWGSTDAGNVTALQSAANVAAVSGGRIEIPEGAANLASASLPITLGSKTTVAGEGRGATQLTVTGTAVAHVFTAVNQKHIKLTGFSLTGNNQSDAFAAGLALHFSQTTAATEIGGSVVVEDCRFSNFKGDFWLYFLNTSDTYTMDDIWVRYNEFISAAGNARDGTSLAVPDACVAFQGEAAGNMGTVRNAWVTHNYAELTHKKMFGIAWHSTENIYFKYNIIENCGADEAIEDNKGAYALMAYENSAASGGPGGSRPDNIYFEHNYISSPRSCGVYVADGNRIFARHNTITGQSDSTDTTLPKAAIAINDATYVVVDGNTITNCYGGVHVGASTSLTPYYIVRNNRISAIRENGFGITARTTKAGKSAGYEILGNSVEGTAAGTRGIWCRFTSASGTRRLLIRDNPIVSAVLRGIELYAEDASVPDVAVAEITGNVVQGIASNFGLAWTNAQDSETRALIARNRFVGTWASDGIMCNLYGSYGLTVVDNEFNDMTSGTGYALRTGLARGRLAGNRFNNVSSGRQVEASGDEDLGYDAPTWTGVIGDFVQNLVPADTTGTSWDYVILGWTYTTSWRALYAPYQDA